jgi:hypothetical protein
LLDLFEKWAAVTEDHPSLLKTLFNWLTLLRDQPVFERLLNAAHLKENEQIDFLERYGLRYLQSFPQSSILLTYTKTFSKYLWSVDFQFFESNISSKNPSSLGQLLEFLHGSSQLYGDVWEFWHTIAVLVKEPGFLQVETLKVSRYTNRLLEGYGARKQISACTQLLQFLGRACVENKDMLEQLVEMFSRVFISSNLMLLLYEIADCAREKREKALFIPCIACAYTFKNRFYEKEEQESFLERFLNTLLQNTDEKTLGWIEGEMRKLHPKIAGRWQKYITRPQHTQPSEATITALIQLFLLWWEVVVARTQLRLALGRKNTTRLAQVSVEYMTTLNGTLSDVWESKIEIALQQLNALEDVRWQQSPVVAPYFALPAKDMAPQQLAKAANTLSISKQSFPSEGIVQEPSWSKRPRVPRRSIITFKDKQITKAFKEVQRSLRSEQIGRIVRVATDYMIVLEAYYQYVPGEWWRMLDAAFDFFIACEVLNTYDPQQEQFIIIASDKIRMLVDTHQPAPRLNEHERQRVKTAVQRIASINMQKMRDIDREWIRLALRPKLGMEPTEQLHPPKTPTETSNLLRRFLNWLASLLLV